MRAAILAVALAAAWLPRSRALAETTLGGRLARAAYASLHGGDPGGGGTTGSGEGSGTDFDVIGDACSCSTRGSGQLGWAGFSLIAAALVVRSRSRSHSRR